MSPEVNPPQFNLREMALSLHEFYTSLIAAGFTEEQAFELVKLTVTNGNKKHE